MEGVEEKVEQTALCEQRYLLSSILEGDGGLGQTPRGMEWRVGLPDPTISPWRKGRREMNMNTSLSLCEWWLRPPLGPHVPGLSPMIMSRAAINQSTESSLW